MKTNLIITIWMTLFCNAFAGTDPNIYNIQFHGSLDQFIIIEERSPRERIYRSVEPNLAADFSFYVDKERHYILNSISGLHYLSYHLPFFMKAGTVGFNFNILSQNWKPYKPIIDPNIPAEIIKPVWVTKSGTKYHTETCRYATTATKISLDEAVKRGLTACSVCKPYVVEPNLPPEPNEPNLAEVLAGVDDPNLIEAIKELMK